MAEGLHVVPLDYQVVGGPTPRRVTVTWATLLKIPIPVSVPGISDMMNGSKAWQYLLDVASFSPCTCKVHQQQELSQDELWHIPGLQARPWWKVEWRVYCG